MSYSVKFTDAALVDLKKLASKTRERVLRKTRWLVENFESLTPETLKGDFSGSFKLRVGDYRIIYSFDEEMEIVEILRVGHRRDVYE